MAFPFALAIPAIMEIVKIGQSILDKRNNGTLTQEEFDAEWAKMQSTFRKNDDAWLASKDQQGQT